MYLGEAMVHCSPGPLALLTHVHHLEFQISILIIARGQDTVLEVYPEFCRGASPTMYSKSIIEPKVCFMLDSVC